MSFMRRMGNYTVAFPGESAEIMVTRDGIFDHTLPTGDVFRGNRRNGTPAAREQRRAQELADVTGSEIVPTRGQHYSPAYSNGNARTWFVKPNGAPGESHRPGWLITVTDYVPGLGWNPVVTHVNTWRDVIAFIRTHFPV